MTVTVKRCRDLAVSTHYLAHADSPATLCGIPAEECQPNADQNGSGAVWTLAIASCFTCQRATTVCASMSGLGADQPGGHAPFADDNERVAYLDAIRADLLRRGYLQADADQRQREDDVAEAHIEESRPA